LARRTLDVGRLDVRGESTGVDAMALVPVVECARIAPLVLRKLVAALFIILIVTPFTEPWPVCPLTQLLDNSPVLVRLLPTTPAGGVDQAAIRRSPGSTEPEVTNPITLLPPPRTNVGTLRVSATPDAPVTVTVSIARIPIPRTADAMSRSGLSVLPPLTLALRV
jgi:hypothetical protein